MRLDPIPSTAGDEDWFVGEPGDLDEEYLSSDEEARTITPHNGEESVESHSPPRTEDSESDHLSRCDEKAHLASQAPHVTLPSGMLPLDWREDSDDDEACSQEMRDAVKAFLATLKDAAFLLPEDQGDNPAAAPEADRGMVGFIYDEHNWEQAAGAFYLPDSLRRREELRDLSPDNTDDVY